MFTLVHFRLFCSKEVSQNVVKNILEKSGYEVITAQNGQDAWDLLQVNDIQMAITDWMMPEMDGKERGRNNFPNYASQLQAALRW